MIELNVYAEAKLDLAELITYYADCGGLTLADRFKTSVDRAFDLLVEYPRIGADLTDGFRRTVLPVFACNVYYVYERDRITVLAVIPGQRDPRAVLDRLIERRTAS